MYAVIAIILGLGGLWASRRFFGTVAAPLGIYSVCWAGLLVLHWLVGMGNAGIFYELGVHTQVLVFSAWGVWIFGCFAGHIDIFPAMPVLRESRFSRARLRYCLVVLMLIGLTATLINLYRLRSTGMLEQSGDAWRETHFISSREIFGRAGFFLDIAVPFAIGGFYAALVLAIYAVVRHGFSIYWAVTALLLGVTNDITSAGRFWLTQAPVIVVAGWLFYSRIRPEGHAGVPLMPRRRTGARPMHGPPVRPPGPTSTRRASNRSVVFAVCLCLGLSYAGLKTVSLMRGTLRTGSETGVSVGGVRLEGALVSPVIYAASSLALFNYYGEYGYDWEPTDGKLAVGGAVYLTGPFTRALFQQDLGKEVVAFNDATNEPRPVGPYKSTVFFTTYLLPAMSDFPDWGIIIYPFVIAWLTTRLFIRGTLGAGIYSRLLYPLAAVWVAISVMKWELVNSSHWPAIVYLLAAGWWLNRSPQQG